MIEAMIGRMYRQSAVNEKEVQSGGQVRGVLKVSAEIGTRLGVGASTIAMAIRRKNTPDGEQL